MTFSGFGSGSLAVLALLDLTTVFDSADHAISLRMLCTSYGPSGSVVVRVISLNCRFSTRYVRSLVRDQIYGVGIVLFGVSQGSVLGPILLYTADLLQFVKCHDLDLHAYAVTDATQRV